MIQPVIDWEQYGDQSHVLYLKCGHSVVRYFVGVPDEHDCTLCDRDAKCNVKMRFLKTWGHPTRNEIYGPGDRVRVSEAVSKMLEQHGTAERIA